MVTRMRQNRYLLPCSLIYIMINYEKIKCRQYKLSMVFPYLILSQEFETWYSMNRMEAQEPESQPNWPAQTGWLNLI